MPGTGHGPRPNVEQARVAADRQCAAPHDLHPGVLLGVVRGGDHDAAVQAELADGVVEHLGSHHPDVDDVCSGLGCAAHDRLRHRRRRQAHVPADCDLPWLELLDVATADLVGAGLVELVGIDPADVVRLEDLGLQHGPRMLLRVGLAAALAPARHT